MFPLRWNFPFRKKDGSITTIDAAINSGGGGGGYTLPTASADTKGGIKVGAGLTMEDEVLKNTNPTPATPYVLPTASAETLGGVKIGSGLSIDENGVVSSSGSSYELPTASSTTKGGVKVNGGMLTMDGETLKCKLQFNSRYINTADLRNLGGTWSGAVSTSYTILGIAFNLRAKNNVTIPDLVCTAYAQKSYNGSSWSIVFKMTPTDNSITDLSSYIDDSQSKLTILYSS